MRDILACLILIAAALFMPACAVAEPDDFRVISGTLVQPETIGSGVTVLVLKSDEGTIYYADLRAVSGIRALQRGTMVTLVGYEGARPDHLVVQAIYPAGVELADTPSVRSQRINGRIGSLAGPTVLVRAADGSEITMLLRGINTAILGLLHSGEVVTVFGQPVDRHFVVTGIIQAQD